MIVVELVFTDDPRRLAARPAHRARLTELRAAGVLVLAGPWADDSGALLLFDCDAAALSEILAADPYYRTPGVTIRIRREYRPLWTLTS
ncbi:MULTISPECIES: YciI family protein [unclassified Crossiella]|uniref:YciI family protein n=1 Tax=unclassified Crossiella TaxID=2620835 RepID=UPI001FFFEE39|nr:MULTISPECIES: YciI family protein [unclassified Crossiella]MCK2240298.1 YciI family protein [Crossiella sp. S99.2]MCK2253250.1 YciI family protein [Crossiella sp. S99.1]